VLVAETNTTSLGLALKQCLLALKDMGKSNGCRSKVFGFVTTWGLLENGQNTMVKTVV
jgi:hypothetical protein